MMTNREIACKLDRMLPSDISLVSLEKAPDGFHARHDAVYRYYVYRILRKRSSLKDRFTWFCHYKLDIEEMKRICEKLTGLHYFRAFSKKMDDEEGYFCRMMKTECIPCAKGEEIQLHFKADRFLYGMVRMLTAAIVDVGRGKMTSETFLTALDTGIRPNMSVSVPAKGLIFREVGLRIF
jgi:tRNA pseudouridine38-40 synthase